MPGWIGRGSGIRRAEMFGWTPGEFALIGIFAVYALDKLVTLVGWLAAYDMRADDEP